MTDDAKSFLFTTFEAGGVLAPVLTIVTRLVRRGHRVRVMSDACNRDEVEAVGADFIAWRRAPSRPGRERVFDTFQDWAAPTPPEGFLAFMNAVLVGPSLAYAEDMIDELRREPADLVVCNEMLFGPQAGCAAIGQKFALVGVNISLFPMPGVPPLGPGFAPARTEEERAMHAEVSRMAVELFDSTLPALNAARTTLGLAPLEHLLDQHKAAEGLLIATSRAFDFAPDVLPPGVSYVGPQLGDPGWAEPWVSPFAADDDRPLVLVSFSTTFQNHVGDLQRVMDALAGLPVKAVVTLGGPISADELLAPANVALVDSAPHHEVMREAVLVITHGGHGTVCKALANGLPQLILPHGRDQADNAVRVTERGAGLALPADASAEAIRTATARLLDEPSFTHAARRLGAAVAREAAESPAAEILEGLAGPREAPRCAA